MEPERASMTIWRLAKTLWVGSLTSLILLHAHGDEIDDAFKAGRTMDITRTEEQRQAARRALEKARVRIQEEAVLHEVEFEDMDPENLLGEINALEDLKAKLAKELESLREPEPEVVPAPAVVQPEPAPAPVDQSTPSPMLAAEDYPDEFSADIQRQISQWREQDMKNQVEQRATVARQQEEMQNSFEKLVMELRSEIQAARSADAEKLERQALAQQKKNQDEMKVAMESLLAQVDERLVALKSGAQDPAQLSREIEKAVNRATAGITRDLEKQFAVLKASVDEVKAGQGVPRGGQESAALSKDVEVLKKGLLDTQIQLREIQGMAALSQDDQAALVKYRKSLKDDILSIREELRGQLQSEIDDLAALIKEEKAARDRAQARQAEQMASLEQSLSRQIAESLGASRPAAETEAVVAALRKENSALREDWNRLEERMVQLEKTGLVMNSLAAGSGSDPAVIKKAMDQALADFKKSESEARVRDMKKIEFALDQYMQDADQRLASVESRFVNVEDYASTAPASGGYPSPANLFEPEVVNVEPEPLADAGEEPAVLSWEVRDDRTQLEELRERLRASLMEHKTHVGADRVPETEKIRQRQLDELASRRKALRKKIEAHPEAAGKGDRLDAEEEYDAAALVPIRKTSRSEPILLKDDRPKRKGLFSWFGRSSKPESTILPPAPAKQLGALEEPSTLGFGRAQGGIREEFERENVIGWQRRSPKAGIQRVEPVGGFGERFEGAEEFNGDVAAPLREGEEGETVRELRGVIDTQMSAMGIELDQHPVFDLADIEVAPTPGPQAELKTLGRWKYEGGFANGRMSGHGKLTYPDGRVYIGQWDRGMRQGRGELIHPDGWIFSGEWGEGLINGVGSLTYSDGWEYSGTWERGKMHGHGVLKHPDGWTYTGGWKNGHMAGKGDLSFGDGWIYQGFWLKGKRDGPGMLTHPDGWQYSGDWRTGKRSGRGTLTFSDGWTYDGDWKNGTMNGKGTLQHPDGWAYEGDWKNGQMTGDGKIIHNE